jgi:RimJ/RimL family protein N-acetyltransferase
MLRGENITLRPVRQSDLDRFFALQTDLTNRGDLFPLAFRSEAELRKSFQETGLWTDDSGSLLIVNDKDEILGLIRCYTTVAYFDEIEIGYIIYDRNQRGKGIATEAVKLLARYLFDSRKVNRLRLAIHPDNKASRRVAEKCGFTHESTARGAWFHKGQNHDLEIYALLRNELPAAGW